MVTSIKLYFVDGLYELEENGSEKAHKFISKELQL